MNFRIPSFLQIAFRPIQTTVFLMVLGGAIIAPGAVVTSTFDIDDEGWTQVNLGGDYRYLDEISFDGACVLHAAAGALTACDPDAGTWMFQAPPKFLGNRSDCLDGHLEFRIRWQGTGVADPNNPVPNVILVSSNIGIARVLGDPPVNAWTTNRIRFDEYAGWLWMNDETGMEALPLATRAQIAQVLASVTALRITGEFITGDDSGFLDDVILAGSGVDRPHLDIRRITTGAVEVSWPATATNFVLEASETLSATNLWTTIDAAGSNAVTVPTATHNTFFRMRQR